MRLEEGRPAPDFALKDADGNVWSLAALRGKKVVVYFYPADDTPGCTIEACDFRDAQAELTHAGYVTLGISPQGAESKKRFAGKHGLNFPLLIDDEGVAAHAFRVATDGGEFQGIPIKVKRSTFVIDEDGKIVKAMYGVGAKGHVHALRESFAV